ncbi:MAG TPA: Dabb family protein [Tepidisphaeraceae bacterium]|jgi:hypothetical protein
MPRQFLTILFVALLTGCHAATPSRSGALDHVVIMWLKEPGNSAARTRLESASAGFNRIDGVEQVRFGRPVLPGPSTRPMVDSSFDLGVIIVFRDEAALRAYEHNPAHQQAASDLLQPLVARYIVYDIAEAH